MKRRLREETVIFVSVVKWLVLASAVGIIAGFSTTVFVKALNPGWAFTSRHPYFFFLMPIGLLLSALCVRLLLREREGHGANWVSVASVISFVISGHRSVYPSQVLAIRKSSSIDVPIGSGA